LDQSVAIDVAAWPEAAPAIEMVSPARTVPSTDDPYSWAPGKPGYEIAKRVTDIVVALAVLVLLSPLWVLIAVLIVTTSRGPVFYRGTVVGRYGRSFTWFKFRSMRVSDDTHHREWIRDFVTSDAPYRNGIYKVTPDHRVTPVGRVLRRLSLDEIPQMINVIRGEMSIVGPRPPLDFEFQLYNPFQCGRLAVRPGITGLHQVTQRSYAPFSAMVALDREYILRGDAVTHIRTDGDYVVYGDFGPDKTYIETTEIKPVTVRETAVREEAPVEERRVIEERRVEPVREREVIVEKERDDPLIKVGPVRIGK